MNNTLSSELIVARASFAARGGDLEEADRLLRDLESTTDPNLAHLDLLARVHAQRGNFADADACWARVQAIDPDNADAVAGRQLIAEISSGRRRARPVFRGLIAGGAGRVGLVAAASACALVAGAAIWVGSSGVASPGGSAAAGPGGDAAVARSETQRADALARQLAALHAEQANEVSRRAAMIDELAQHLALPGVRVDRRPDSVQVVFDQGLFSPDSGQLTPAGAAKLAELGSRLAGRDVSTTVIGHTVAVPGGPSSGGSVVGQWRAIVAAQALANGSGAPLTAFTLISADQTRNPFPEPARNRTVTLLIVPNAKIR